MSQWTRHFPGQVAHGRSMMGKGGGPDRESLHATLSLYLGRWVQPMSHLTKDPPLYLLVCGPGKGSEYLLPSCEQLHTGVKTLLSLVLCTWSVMKPLNAEPWYSNQLYILSKYFKIYHFHMLTTIKF